MNPEQVLIAGGVVPCLVLVLFNHSHPDEGERSVREAKAATAEAIIARTVDALATRRGYAAVAADLAVDIRVERRRSRWSSQLKELQAMRAYAIRATQDSD